MSNLQYHSQNPENANSAGYSEFQNLDFVVQISGRKLLKNSMRLVGDVVINVDGAGAAMADTTEMFVDNRVGHHSWFESFTCESSQGILEHLNEYPRYCALATSATHSRNDFISALANAEGKNPCALAGRLVIQPVKSFNDTTAGGITTFNTDASFAIQPKILFNRMLGAGDWSFDRMGYVRISTVLARSAKAMYGSAMVAATRYTLKNVRLEYQTIPDDGKSAPMLAHSYVNIKSTINSTHHNLSAKVPAAACNGVVVSYLEQSKENSLTANTLQLEQLPQPQELQYLFNNSMQKYLTYNMTDRREMVARGLDALSNGGHQRVNGDSLAANDGYLTGLSFDEYISLESQRFNIQTRSAHSALSTSPLTQFCYFLTLVKLA